jgi:H+/Cl- antiporter ClcA
LKTDSESQPVVPHANARSEVTESHEGSEKVKRTLYISTLALINAVIVGFIAKALLMLINFFNNLFFFGQFSFHEVSPAHHHLGYGVIVIPVVGGLIVGLMARFGSRAIPGAWNSGSNGKNL